VVWIRVNQDMDKGRTVVNTVMKIRSHKTGGISSLGAELLASREVLYPRSWLVGWLMGGWVLKSVK